jgi:hypothetical protein
MKNKEHIKFSSYHDTWKTMCCLYGCNWALLTYMHVRIIDIVVPWRKIKLKIECMSNPNKYTMKEVPFWIYQMQHDGRVCAESNAPTWTSIWLRFLIFNSIVYS